MFGELRIQNDQQNEQGIKVRHRGLESDGCWYGFPDEFRRVQLELYRRPSCRLIVDDQENIPSLGVGFELYPPLFLLVHPTTREEGSAT